MAFKSGMKPVHPGLVLREELDDIGLSANALAKAIGVPANRVTAILNGERGITADTALRLGRHFDTTAEFWLNLQQAWQLRLAESRAHLQSTTTRDATPGPSQVVGLDGCKDGWIAAVVVAGRLTAIEYHDSASKVVLAHPRARVFAVDIPIGLSPNGRRKADLEARKCLSDGRRNASEAERKRLSRCTSRVFNAPAACVLDAGEYEEAKQRSECVAGCGLTQQSFALLPKIREVASVVASDSRVRETHPEICFTKMNEGTPLPSKKTWDGLMLRKTLLAEAGLVIPERVDVACDHSADDVVDAVACAWAAIRIDDGEAQSIPAEPETINDSLVAIWA